MDVKEITRNVLDATGLLKPVRSLRRDMKSAGKIREKHRYLEELLAVYRNPLSHAGKPLEQMWMEDRRKAEADRVRRRFEGDRAALDAALGARATGDRVSLVRTVLDRLLEDGLFPHSYEYDFVEDIVSIVRGRYVDWNGPHDDWSKGILRSVSTLVTGDPLSDPAALPRHLHALLGAGHGYSPRRGQPHPWARQVIPDLFEELVALKARDNPGRLLDISRQYSERQRDNQGTWGPQLSLLVGYERDYHLMLRKLVELTGDGRLRADDEALVIGPRHKDEIHFFRSFLGLPKTIGLDLFDAKRDGIEAGDMHAMAFSPRRFRLVYTCSTLTYAYDLRKVVGEILRVLARPGYVILSDAARRQNGVDALGRTDVVSADAMVGCFCDAKFSVVFHDEGRRPTAESGAWPSIGLRIE